MKVKFYLFIILAICFVAFPFQIFAQKSETEIIFCQFPVSRDIKLGNANFSLIYSFRVDSNGNPIKISVLNDFPIAKITKEQVVDCISEWHFANLKIGTILIADFRWEHGKEWTELHISGKDFKQKIRLENKE